MDGWKSPGGMKYRAACAANKLLKLVNHTTIEESMIPYLTLSSIFSDRKDIKISWRKRTRLSSVFMNRLIQVF